MCLPAASASRTRALLLSLLPFITRTVFECCVCSRRGPLCVTLWPSVAGGLLRRCPSLQGLALAGLFPGYWGKALHVSTPQRGFPGDLPSPGFSSVTPAPPREQPSSGGPACCGLQFTLCADLPALGPLGPQTPSHIPEANFLLVHGTGYQGGYISFVIRQFNKRSMLDLGKVLSRLYETVSHS